MKPYAPCPADLHQPDGRFRTLLGDAAWAQLPVAIQRRFGKCLQDGATVVYKGAVVDMHMNVAGKLLATLARFIGGPLPYDLSSVDQPAVVSVTEDTANQGQFWIRQYGRAAGFPQVVHSSKRFAGPTGLEEYIGCGVGVALNVLTEENALLFKSAHYFVQLGTLRVRLPRALSPGALTIGHHDYGNGQFLFSLSLKNRLFGDLIQQDAVFNDSKE